MVSPFFFAVSGVIRGTFYFEPLRRGPQIIGNRLNIAGRGCCTASGFLGLESLDLHLQAPINVIIGENEAGKSSNRDAIQWYFTGQARGLKTQQEQAALIRDGSKAAEVSLTFADGRTRTRRRLSAMPGEWSFRILL